MHFCIYVYRSARVYIRIYVCQEHGTTILLVVLGAWQGSWTVCSTPRPATSRRMAKIQYGGYHLDPKSMENHRLLGSISRSWAILSRSSRVEVKIGIAHQGPKKSA